MPNIAVSGEDAAQFADSRGRPERGLWRLFGPAFVAAVAYVDPGNVAANLTAGASYGYLLLWVLVAANAMAVVIQYLSAKLGLVTGKTLPQLIGERLGRRSRLAFWAQAEIIAATGAPAQVEEMIRSRVDEGVAAIADAPLRTEARAALIELATVATHRPA